MSNASDRLATTRDAINGALEVRIAELLGIVQAAAEITRQVAAVEEELDSVETANEEIEAELRSLRAMQTELLDNLGDLANGLGA